MMCSAAESLVMSAYGGCSGSLPR